MSNYQTDYDTSYIPPVPELRVYRNRTHHSRQVEAVQYTRDNGRPVFEWAPCKQRFEPGMRVEGLTIFTGPGQAGRDRAVYGDWVFRDIQGGSFWVASPEAFEDSYELTDQEPAR